MRLAQWPHATLPTRTTTEQPRPTARPSPSSPASPCLTSAAGLLSATRADRLRRCRASSRPRRYPPRAEGWVQWAAEATASTLNAGPAVKTPSRAVVRPAGRQPYRARGAGDGAARLWFPAGVGCLVRARLWIKGRPWRVQPRVSGLRSRPVIQLRSATTRASRPGSAARRPPRRLQRWRSRPWWRLQRRTPRRW